jgi:phytoene dehydrogenase-like protein
VPERTDAVVVGAGPNGLAAAISLAQQGRSVLVLEAEDEWGGGLRTDEGTLPGYRHDVCSAIHPLAAGSPFLSRLPLEDHGLEWVHPDVPLAHPLDEGPAVLLHRSTAETAAGLGADGGTWQRLFDPLVEKWPAIRDQFLGPVRLPRRPFTVARFGLLAIRSAAGLAAARFSGQRAAALFGGMAAHAFLPLDGPTSAGFGIVLGTAGHAIGWPLAKGGSQALADAMVSHLRSLGGEVVTGQPVKSLGDIPPTRIAMFDLTPAQMLRIAGDAIDSRRTRQLARFRYGPGVFKIDYALDGPVPWKAEGAGRAGTVHLGGTMAELVRAEGAVAKGRHPDRPYVLVAQQSTFDRTRAPHDGETLWAYCHVPNGSTVDMTEPIERQLERFAPGFRDRVLERRTITAAAYEQYNMNYVGGDISGGANDGAQLLLRPRVGLDPYLVSPGAGDRPEIFLCSSSTPPGGGVHGMCGFHAARFALSRDDRRAS